MTHSEEDKEKFLEILAATPFIRHAAKKAAIHPSTIYEWRDADPAFREKLKNSLKNGRSSIVEIGEVALVKKVQEGELGAIKYLLSNNSKRYSAKYPTRLPEPQDKETSEPPWDGKITVSKTSADIVKHLRRAEEQIRQNNPVQEDPSG